MRDSSYQGVPVFDVFCPRHGSVVLLPFSRIRELVNGPEGITVHLECYDDEQLVMRTGRAPRRDLPPVLG